MTDEIQDDLPLERDPDEGRRLAERVSDLVEQGRPESARIVLGRNWSSAAPDLPLRFGAVLEDVTDRGLRRLARSVGEGRRPQLETRLRGSRKARAIVMAFGERLGSLPAEQATFLHSLADSDFAQYQTSLIAIRLNGTVEVELARESSDDEAADAFALHEALDSLVLDEALRADEQPSD